MHEYTKKRPFRLEYVASENIMAALLALMFIRVMFSKSSFAKADIFSVPFSLWFGIFASVMMIGGSVAALMGRPSGHRIMLAVAVVFYGNLLREAYVAFQEAAPDRMAQIWIGCFVFLFGTFLAKNFWAALSAKTRAYFAARRYA